jgi:hypothetical protein
MAIMGFIIVVAGRVFSDSTVMRVRSQNMIKTAEEVGKIANLISEDISQMGAKAWGKKVGDDYEVYIASNDNNASEKAKELAAVYMTTADRSSFNLERNYNNTEFDRLVFRKAEFNASGDFEGVREVSWEVNGDRQLIRRCRSVELDSPTCPKKDKIEEADEVFITDSVKKFSFFLSKPGVSPSVTGSAPSLNMQEDIVFPYANATRNQNSFKLTSKETSEYMKSIYPSNPTSGEYPIVSIKGGFAKNDNPNAKNFNQVHFSRTDEDGGDCFHIPIQKGETYIVEFKMPFPKSEKEMDIMDTDNEEKLGDASIGQFLPGKDHIAVGLRDGDKNIEIEDISSDVLLYAPQSDDADNNFRYAEFTANDKFDPSKAKNICVALTFSFYSQLAYEGELKFSHFKIYKKNTGAYHFVKKEDYVEEKALKYATTDDDASTNEEKFNRKRNVKAIELLLEISRNGEVAGTISKDSKGMAIPVPNNGATL